MINTSTTRQYLSLAALLATVPSVAEESPRPILEVGALVNFDLGGVPPQDLGSDDLPAGLADAELSAGLAAAGGWRADLVLVNEDGNALVDQAWTSWKGEKAGFQAGRFTLAYGVYGGSWIGDPLLQQDVETILPAVAGSWKAGPLTLQAALASESVETDSGDAESVASFFPALDYGFGEEGLIRLSARLAEERREVDLGLTAPLGALTVSAEALLADGDDATVEYAAFAGLTWQALEKLEVYGRGDIRKPVDEDRQAFATAGAFLHLGDCFTAGAEWAHDLEESEGALTLRAGFEASWSSE